MFSSGNVVARKRNTRWLKAMFRMWLVVKRKLAVLEKKIMWSLG
jgi:hypothetical protein